MGKVLVTTLIWYALLMPLAASLALVHFRWRHALPIPLWLGATLGGAAAWAATPFVLFLRTKGRGLEVMGDGGLAFLGLVSWVVLAVPTATAIGAVAAYLVGRLRPSGSGRGGCPPR
ncbi:MAG: hypothetical protein KKI08_15790 [Armatimonadetes bacterium]|nr:hypothetical protein [Armatimonadota bacterium]